MDGSGCRVGLVVKYSTEISLVSLLFYGLVEENIACR